MPRAKRAIALIASSLVLGCLAWAFVYLSQPTILSFIDPQAREIIQEADSVQVLQITSMEEVDGKMHYLRPARQASTPKGLTRPQIAQVLHALNKPGADQAKAACSPNPGIEFVFVHQGRSVRLDLCFHCAAAEFMDSAGQDLGSSNFRHVRPELIAVCKEVFPDNPAVQRLGEDNGEDLEQVPVVQS